MGNSCTSSEILFAVMSVPLVIFTGASFLINAATADEGGEIFLESKKKCRKLKKIIFSHNCYPSNFNKLRELGVFCIGYVRMFQSKSILIVKIYEC